MKNWKQFRKNSYMTDEIGLKCAIDVLKHIYYLKGNMINFVYHCLFKKSVSQHVFKI